MGCVRPEFNSQHPDISVRDHIYSFSMFLSIFAKKRLELERKNRFRNFIFGVEDSLVSTVGLLSGIAAAATPRPTIITSGIVLIFVEAFSMGVGSYLSEETAEESTNRRFSRGSVFKSSLVMFFSYFLAGFIPLTPYVLLGPSAELISITVTLAALALLGAVSAYQFAGSILRKSLEMLLLGGLAALIGIGVGSVFRV